MQENITLILIFMRRLKKNLLLILSSLFGFHIYSVQLYKFVTGWKRMVQCICLNACSSFIQGHQREPMRRRIVFEKLLVLLASIVFCRVLPMAERVVVGGLATPFTTVPVNYIKYKPIP